MGSSGKCIGICVVLLLCVTRPVGALAFDREPVTGGLVATPGDAPAATPQVPAAGVPAPTPPEIREYPEAPPEAPAWSTPAPAPAEPAPAPAAGPTGAGASWGVLARGGYFGLPDVIANKLFRQHPRVTGIAYGGEIRFYGAEGARGGSALGIAVDAGKVEGNGIWQTDEHDSPAAAGGEISMLAVTVTRYWSIFPSWEIHPSVGLGVGAGYFKGSVRSDNDLTEVSVVLPVLHVPVGLAIEIDEHLELSFEARFLGGFTAGGALQLRF